MPEALKPYLKKYRREAGCDEAGRGCLAGPVTAAAVILPPQFDHPTLRDSKKMSAAQREILRPIIEKEALAWAVAHVSPQKIDEINILQASFLAMHRALEQLAQPPHFLLIDGNRFTPYRQIPHQCIVKGDSLYRSIAAASVLAKTHRDDLMKELHSAFPQYDWLHNKGYPTRKHRSALQHYGATHYHRSSFALQPLQLKLPLHLTDNQR